ncbi:MAG TPA: hypothetical protein VGN69_01080 [Solirubrobacteraceae bacterium]|nr:hypothetical protein [Solirubrobacteraceae bacterium]
MADSPCPSCGLVSSSAHGLCPSCGYAKNPTLLPRQQVLKGSFWSDASGVIGWGLVVAPCLVLGVGAVIWLGTAGLIVAVLLLVVVAVLSSVLGLV